MGKAGGFLKQGRQEPGYRDRDERVTDFDAVELRLDEDSVRKQASRCMECGTPFCHGAGCPLSNVIPEFNDLAYHGRWAEAADILLATSNFPEITARVCPALCEAACVLGINDDPVSVRQVELAVIETAFERGHMAPSPPAERLDKNVAIAGGGPAGLAAADSLNKAGVNVVVYDSALKPGGVLRYGIPDFKLEKWIIDRRIDLMKHEGVVFESGVAVGEDISCRYLNSRFDAICLAGGSRDPRDLDVPGRELTGVHFAMDYLVCQNMKVAGEFVDESDDITAEGKTVVVIGGGDTGSDCVGTAIRQGAKAVHQIEILPKPSEQRPEHTPWPMWPDILRESSSHKEGCERRWSVQTEEFVGRKGNVSGLKCVEVDCRREDDGRLSFTPKKGSTLELKAQLVLLALGFVGPGRNAVVDELGIGLDKKGNVVVDGNNMTSAEGVFAAGDMARGQSLVVRALADGRKAADGIVRYLKNG